MPDDTRQTQKDDEAVAARIAQGDENALRLALETYGGKIRGYLVRQFGEQLDESERNYVFQKALIKFWRKIGTYTVSKGSLRGWWIRIARNAAIDHIRGEKRFETTELAEDPAEPCDKEADVGELCPRDRRRLERVYDFIHKKLKGMERAVALQCFAVEGEVDSVRLAAKFGRTRAYIDVVKSKVKKKIQEYVLALEADESERKDTP